ncbi:MAG TPA: hypothetical protein VFG69_16195 [Nannocystaceae bacterium]|nr:hypothetical protein [Nannocystaceae bacterium]
MKARLRDIVRRLADAKQAASLTDDDFAYLAGLVAADEAGAGGDAARPLWAHLSRRALVHAPVFDAPRWDFGANKIFAEAGMPTAALTYEDNEQRWILPVTTQSLRRAIAWGLQQDDAEVRWHAAVLIGFAGYDDLLHLLVDDLESGRGERASYGGARIAGAIQALAMADHPRAAALALPHVGSDDWSIRNAARMACLTCQHQLGKEELERVFDASFEVYDFTKIGHAFVQAAARGGFSRERLAQVIESLHLDAYVTQTVADLIVTAGWQDEFAKYIEHDDSDLRTALALRVAWSDAMWARDAVRARLDREDVEQAHLGLLTALGSFDDRTDAVLEEKLDSGSEWERTGAIWGTIGRAKFESRVRAQLGERDPLVRSAAACALSALQPEQPAAAELAWNALLNRDDWWPWAAGLRALRARNVPLPQSVQGFVLISRAPATIAEVDAGVAFFRGHVGELLRWLGREGSSYQRARALQYAGLVGGEAIRAAVEQVLVAAPTLDESVKAGRELVGLGGPEHPLARVKLGIATSLNHPLGPDDLEACVVLANQGVYDIHIRATTALARLGKGVESQIGELLFHADNDISQAAAEAIGRMQSGDEPIVRDAAALLDGSVRKVSELETLDRLFNCPAKRIREALAEAAGRAENQPDDVLHMLLRLAVDKEASVATAAAASLATRFPEFDWIKQLILRNSRADDWQLTRGSVTTMAQIGDPVFVPRLVELAMADDTGQQDSAVRGLERVSERFPSLGLIVLDIRDPYRLASRYSLTDQVDHNADRHSEALRLLMLALDKKRSVERASKEDRRKVMLTPLGPDTELSPSENGWDEATFEQLALYLSVTFIDEESSTIIAEVSTEPTGEVLSALLQTRAVCATTIAWS